MYNKSPFYMNLRIILLIRSLSYWVAWLLNKWLFSVIIIFYLGGIIVLFAYIISISKSKYTFFIYPFLGWLLVRLMFRLNYSFLPANNKIYFKLYYLTNIQGLFILALILLILLVVVNKLCITRFGPLNYKHND